MSDGSSSNSMVAFNYGGLFWATSSAVTSKSCKSVVKRTAPEFRLLCALLITQIFDTLPCALSA